MGAIVDRAPELTDVVPAESLTSYCTVLHFSIDQSRRFINLKLLSESRFFLCVLSLLGSGARLA